jgi:hypothetical protein
VPNRLWIAKLLISDRTATKISSKHSLSPNAVRDELECREGVEAVWDVHPERGGRWLVQVVVGHRRVIAVLYPRPDLGQDTFALGSAYKR